MNKFFLALCLFGFSSVCFAGLGGGGGGKRATYLSTGFKYSQARCPKGRAQ